MEEIKNELIKIGCIKTGDFTLKSGKKSNIYVDLRNVISYPKLLQDISETIITNTTSNFERVCGVPYGAIPIASQVSLFSDIPMILKRKETKNYGTKKTVEGEYQKGDRVLLIEDVITSGESIIETIKELEQNELIVEEIIVILDREEGGVDKIKNNGYKIKSLFKLSELTKEESKKTKKLPQSSSNYLSDKLLKIAHKKKSNLILSCDLTHQKEIIDVLKLLGDKICAVKLHSDIIIDFDKNFVYTLKYLANYHDFLIIEDRKFADIGYTQYYQFTQGHYKISSWADIVTTHLISGKDSLSVFEDIGVIPILEMSTYGALTDSSYVRKCKKIISEQNENVVGVVCQKSNTDGLLKFTPGVHLNDGYDFYGQRYITPKYAISELSSDFLIIGRGLYMSKDPLKEIEKYLNEVKETNLFDEERID